MSGLSTYYNVEDLPGDPSALELALGKLRAQHALTPFEDVVLWGNTAMLLVGGELCGSVDLEALSLLGLKA